MGKRLLLCAFAVLLFAGVGLAGEKAKAKAKHGSWTGWVTDTYCVKKGHKVGHTEAKECVKHEGTKYALYNPSDGKVYVLDAKTEQVDEFAGQYVQVEGEAEGETIKASSIQRSNEEEKQ